MVLVDQEIEQVAFWGNAKNSKHIKGLSLHLILSAGSKDLSWQKVVEADIQGLWTGLGLGETLR